MSPRFKGDLLGLYVPIILYKVGFILSWQIDTHLIIGAMFNYPYLIGKKGIFIEPLVNISC